MKTIKNILLPIDFEENNTEVLKLASIIAQYSDSQIILLHMYSRPLATKAGRIANDIGILTRLERYRLLQLERQISNGFRQLYHSVPALQDCKVKFVHKKGLIVKNILKSCDEYAADLVIMGTHGIRKSGRRHNSNTARVSLKAHRPVLVVPYEGHIDAPSKIAFTYDLKTIPDYKQLDIIKILSLTYRADIHVISINHRENKLSSAQKVNLQMIKDYFEDFEPTVHFIPEHDMKLGISRYVRKNSISMLAVLHRSRNAFKKIFHRSLTKRLALHSTIPVLALDGGTE